MNDNECPWQAGEEYRTREGRRVLVYKAATGGEYSIHGAFWCDLTAQWHPTCWRADGTGAHEGSDLLPPAPKTLDVDWDAMPAWANWVALGNSGGAFWYSHRPTRRMGAWYMTTTTLKGEVPKADECCRQYVRNPHNLAWHESLTARPGLGGACGDSEQGSRSGGEP